MVYEDLIRQFEDLSDEEKNILLVYKSKLGVAINSLDNNDEKVLEIYNNYKKILDNPKNMFMKMTVFKDISFDNEISFRESLTDVKDKLLKISTTLKINNDLTVYRLISVPKNVDISGNSLLGGVIGSFITYVTKKDREVVKTIIKNGKSTTPAEFDEFLETYNNILYNEKEEQLTLTKTRDQKEIILNKDNFSFDCYDESLLSLDDLDVNVRLIDSYIKVKDDRKITK